MILKYKKEHKPNKRNYTDPQEPRYANFELNQEPIRHRPFLKVVSYNIKYSQRIEKAIALLLTNAELNDADIICLQEMTLGAVEKISTALKFNYVYYPAVFHPILNNDFGNAVLSRLPILSDQKIILPHLDPRHMQRTAINVTVEFNKMPIVISNVHFKVLMRPSYRAQQINALLRSLPPQETRFIIAGDFNTFSKANSRAILEPLINANFIPATDGLGWSHKHWTLLNKRSQLDHIFIKGLEVIKTGKVINRKSSDHLPIWAQVSLTDKALV